MKFNCFFSTKFLWQFGGIYMALLSGLFSEIKLIKNRIKNINKINHFFRLEDIYMWFIMIVNETSENIIIKWHTIKMMR